MNLKFPRSLVSMLSTLAVALPTEGAEDVLLDRELSPRPKSLARPQNAFVRDPWSDGKEYVRRQDRGNRDVRNAFNEKRLAEAKEKRAKKAAKRQANAEKHAAAAPKAEPIKETEGIDEP